MKQIKVTNIKQLKRDDWVLLSQTNKYLITKILGIIKHAKIENIKRIKHSIRIFDKNYNGIGLKIYVGNKSYKAWGQLRTSHLIKILDAKDVKKIKTDIAIIRFIKLKGLDKHE